MSMLQQPCPPADHAAAAGPASLAAAAVHGRGPVPAPRGCGAVREAACTAVLAALDGPGAVVLGPPGIGKTTLARAAVARHPGACPVQLRGSALSAQTPYGALAWLLSGFTAAELAGPVQVVRALEAQLLRQAAGRRIVLVIDNAEELDDLTVLVTTQLCRQGTAALLLIAGDLIRCHRGFIRLWTDGALQRVDLAPLDLAQTGELLDEAAGGPLTGLARRVLWERSRGNPLVASLLCRDHIAAGSLVRRRGFWAWAGPPVHTGELPERIETMLHRFDADGRRAVEILALSRELPLDAVLQLVSADTVDALEESSVVTVGAGREQPVRLAWYLQAATIASRIPFGRSRDLWAEVHAVLDPGTLSGAAAAGLAAWSLTCGVALEPGAALAAAQWANTTGDPDAALRFARSLPAGNRATALRLEEAAALEATGQHEAAYRVLADAGTATVNNDDGGGDGGGDGDDGGGAGAGPADDDAAAPEAAADLRLRLLTSRALAAARLPVRPEDPEALLDQAGQLLGADNGVRPGPALRVNLARAGLLVLEGRLAELPAALHEDFADPASPPLLRLWAGIRLAEQHAAAGRFAEALVLATAVRGRLRAGIQAGDRTRELFFQHLLFLLIRCGELGEALALTTAAADPGSGSGLRTATGPELPTGLVHAYAGRAAAAVAELLPALAQLEAGDPDDLLPLAHAAAAYAGSLTPAAENPAGPVPPPDFAYRPDPAVHSAVRYFRILAGRPGSRQGTPQQGTSHLGTPKQGTPPEEPAGDTAAALHTFAQQALAAGNVPDALLGLAAEALRGSRPAAADLAAAAAAATGPAADMFAALAAGLLENDVPALLAAADAALEQQDALLAYVAAQRAHLLAAAGGSRAAVRRARHLEYECFRALSPENSVEYGLAQLGDFERELAVRAAAGETSAALGERFHLSARTVDWHLGRVFARLHVSGRSDLREILSRQQRNPGPRVAAT